MPTQIALKRDNVSNYKSPPRGQRSVPADLEHLARGEKRPFRQETPRLDDPREHGLIKGVPNRLARSVYFRLTKEITEALSNGDLGRATSLMRTACAVEIWKANHVVDREAYGDMVGDDKGALSAIVPQEAAPETAKDDHSIARALFFHIYALGIDIRLVEGRVAVTVDGSPSGIQQLEEAARAVASLGRLIEADGASAAAARAKPERDKTEDAKVGDRPDGYKDRAAEGKDERVNREPQPARTPQRDATSRRDAPRSTSRAEVRDMAPRPHRPKSRG